MKPSKVQNPLSIKVELAELCVLSGSQFWRRHGRDLGWKDANDAGTACCVGEEFARVHRSIGGAKRDLAHTGSTRL